MELTQKQQEGLEIAVKRYKENKPWTCISGYAGTGKSTLVSYIIAALGLNPTRDVAYIAYTGKAATVLTSKGCPNAKTAHKFLYNTQPLPNGRFKFTPKRVLDADYKLIVVDEVSMLSKTLWDLLLSHKVHVIACGDPEQLPPIDKSDVHNVLDTPHIFLDEIMRQVADSEIIQASMKVRTGGRLQRFDGKEVKVMRPFQLNGSIYLWADQILCATNQTRNKINAEVRELKGYPKVPVVGDKVIGLRNHWDDISVNGNALTNGTIGYIEPGFELKTIRYPSFITTKEIPVLLANIRTEDGDLFQCIPIDYNSLTTGTKTLTDQEEFTIRKFESLPTPPYEFAYGYAITTWKAQGSEWNKVLLIEEGFPFSADEHRRYMYTGITRASEKLVTIIK